MENGLHFLLFLINIHIFDKNFAKLQHFMQIQHEVAFSYQCMIRSILGIQNHLVSRIQNYPVLF